MQLLLRKGQSWSINIMRILKKNDLEEQHWLFKRLTSLLCLFASETESLLAIQSNFFRSDKHAYTDDGPYIFLRNENEKW